MKQATIGRTVSFIFLILLSALLLGADDAACCSSKCQEALDHMGDAIQRQLCDPSTMSNARTRIEDDCDKDYNVNLAIGNLVEQCRSTAGDVPRVTCSNPGSNTRIAIDFVNSTTAADGVGAIDFSVRDSGGVTIYFNTSWIEPGQTERMSFVANNGDGLSFRVRDGDVYAEVLGQHVDFVNDRLCIRGPADWSPYTYRRVIFGLASDGAPIVWTENFNCD